MITENEITELTPVPAEPNRNIILAKRNTPWLFFGLIGGGLIFAALSRAALTWDGSYILFKALDSQTPFIAHGRWFTVILQLPALLLSKVTDNMTLLGIVFSLCYAAIPFIALLLAWWVVRRVNPGLFVWAAFGIALVSLPGQFFFVSEALLALQLSWPFLLAFMVGVRRESWIIVSGLAVSLFLSHPIVIPIFMLAGIIGLVRGWVLVEERRYMWIWAAGCSLLAIVAALRFFVRSDNYESDQLSADVLGTHFSRAVVGLPLIALAGIGLTTCLVFAAALQRFFNRRTNSNPAVLTIWRGVEFAGLGLAGGVLIWQAADSHNWDGSIDYRFWALIFSLPLFLFALIESLLLTYESTYAKRLPLIQFAGVIFLVVLAVQSTSWFNLTNRLNENTNQNAQSCSSTAALPWAAQTPLGHWSVSAYSLLQDNKQPQKVVLAANGCTAESLGKGLQVTQWDLRDWKTGWFDLQPLAAKMAVNVKAQTPPPTTCNFTPVSGWYPNEQNGTDWWRWTENVGKIRVYSPGNAQVTLQGNLRSMPRPNEVQVLLNGQPITSIGVDWENLQPFTPIPLNLKQGNNELIFVSKQPAIQAENDPRRLAIVVGNLRFLDSSNKSLCEFRNE